MYSFTCRISILSTSHLHDIIKKSICKNKTISCSVKNLLMSVCSLGLFVIQGSIDPTVSIANDQKYCFICVCLPIQSFTYHF